MSDRMRDLPHAEAADPDGVQVALRAAHTLWSHGDTAESLRWLSRAAETALDEGADIRSVQLAKAAADLRSRLVGSLSPGSSPVAGGHSSIPQAKQGVSASSVAVSTPLVAARLTDIPMAAIPVAASTGQQPAWSQPPESAPPPLPNQSAPNHFAANPSAPTHFAATQSAPNQDAPAIRTTEPPPSDMQNWLASSMPPAAPPQSIPPPLPASSYGQPSSQPVRAEQHTIAIDSLDEDSAPVSAAMSEPDSAPLSEGGIYAVKSSPQSSAGKRAYSNSFEGSNYPLREGSPASTVRSESLAPSIAPYEVSENISSEELEDDSADFAIQGTETGMQRGAELSGPGVLEPASPESASLGQQKLTARVHHQAVRVAILADTLSDGQFLVRPLREGEPAPNGARVALLVALEPGTPLV